MAVTLSEAKNNTQQDYDPAVIDEFRKESAVLDSLIFDDAVNPAGGGATLEYGYRRLATQPTANTRALNSEYTPANVTTSKHNVELAVMGGSFEVDRVIASLGPAASGTVMLNMQQKIKAAVTKFQDEAINGNTDVDANGFDGLNKALTGSSTEFKPASSTDWSALATTESRLTALDGLDEFLSLLDGTPTVLLGNTKALAKIRSIVRGTGMYVRNPVDGLVGQNGRPINREEYGGVIFADPGNKAGTNDPIIPIQTRSLKWSVNIAGGTTSNKITVTVDGVSVDVALTGAAAISDGALEDALESIVGVGNVAVSSKVATFERWVAMSAVGDGTAVPTVAVEGATTATGLTDIYAYRVGMDGFHGVTTVGSQIVRTWLPDFSAAGAVKKGEVELGPVAVALKATRAAAVFRNIKVQ